MTSPHGIFHFASHARAAPLSNTSCHNMSDWKAHHSLTLKDNEGHTVNAGRHVVADSDSVSRVRCNVSNSARSRSPAVVKVKCRVNHQLRLFLVLGRGLAVIYHHCQSQCFHLGWQRARGLKLCHFCLAPLSLHLRRLRASMLRHAVRGQKS